MNDGFATQIDLDMVKLPYLQLDWINDKQPPTTHLPGSGILLKYLESIELSTTRAFVQSVDKTNPTIDILSMLFL